MLSDEDWVHDASCDMINFTTFPVTFSFAFSSIGLNSSYIYIYHYQSNIPLSVSHNSL